MRLPILIYHDIGNTDTNVPSVESDLYSLAPDTFEGHLQSIVRRQVSTLTMEDPIRACNNGTSHTTGICLTFDDGYLSNYDTVCPLLTQYGIKGIFFHYHWTGGMATARHMGTTSRNERCGLFHSISQPNPFISLQL
jgi:hypothetical protein